jgi:hypothetical protein
VRSWLPRKKPNTKSAFSSLLEEEYVGALRDMRHDVNRQLWGSIKVQPKYPWVVKKAIAAYRRAHKWRGKHQGFWQHSMAVEEWYEDCECCGQPKKYDGSDEYWYRTCLICGHYETRDTDPEPKNPEMRGFSEMGKSFIIPTHRDHVHVSTSKNPV